jgi:hypothetical protein
LYLDLSTLAFAAQEQKAAWIADVAELYEYLPAASQKNAGMAGVTPAALNRRSQLTNVELHFYTRETEFVPFNACSATS